MNVLIMSWSGCLSRLQSDFFQYRLGQVARKPSVWCWHLWLVSFPGLHVHWLVKQFPSVCQVASAGKREDGLVISYVLQYGDDKARVLLGEYTEVPLQGPVGLSAVSPSIGKGLLFPQADLRLVCWVSFPTRAQISVPPSLVRPLLFPIGP